MFIKQSELIALTEEAKTSSRLRMNQDLRTTANDSSQRMLNALEPGTIMPIHRHRNTSETMVMIKGSLIERFYDNEGNVTEEVVMKPNGECSVVQIPAGQWHSLEVLESGTVIFEAKDGAYAPLLEDDILKLDK